MRHGVVVWVAGAVLLAGIGVVGAGDEHQLNHEELRAEMARNRALATYVARNGEPDVAETHFLADRPPWDDHEVTLYYLDARTEIGFACAWILGRPEVQIERYERPLGDERVAAPAARAFHRGGREPGPAERAEDAARRAESAAGRVEMAAASAERAADRAEAVVGETESAPERALPR